MPRPLPRINRDSATYWESARAHELKLQRCNDCGKLRFYPSLSCHYCGSLDAEWTTVNGEGEVYTYSVVYRAPGAPFADLLPLVVAMVTLDEGPTMMSNVVGVDPSEVKIGMRVRLTYEDVNDACTLPVFVPIGDEPPAPD
jgi:uncharacterized OB-fold protein